MRRLRDRPGSRLIARAAVLVPVVTLVLVLGAGPSLASCYSTRYPAGSTTVTFGATGHDARSSWDASRRYLNMSMEAANMPSGTCVDTWFDWATSAGHYDARVVRVCLDYAARYSNGGAGITEPSTPRRLLGIQKAAGCYYDRASQSLVRCYQSSKNTSGCAIKNSRVAVLPGKCARAWGINASGQSFYYDGGDPWLCSS